MPSDPGCESGGVTNPAAAYSLPLAVRMLRAVKPLEPTAVPILYRDESLVIVAKPSGLLVHRGWARDELVAMSLVRDAVGGWVYPVHRLDRGASGALAFALSPQAAAPLGEAFATGAVDKRYLALVRGVPPTEGVIDYPLPRRPDGPRVPAITAFCVLARYGRYTFIEARPRTGRLHQIRKHLKHIACPLIGDVKYGKGEHNRFFRERFALDRLALHAHQLTVPHPSTGRAITVQAPLPAELQRALDGLAALDRDRRQGQ